MSCCKPNPYEEDPHDLSDSVPSHDGSCACNEGCIDESPPSANYTESSLSVPFKSHRNLCCGGDTRNLEEDKDKWIPKDEINYEEKVLEEKMRDLSLAEIESANRAVEGDSPTATKIWQRRSLHQLRTGGLAEEPAFLALKFRELNAKLDASIAKKYQGYQGYVQAKASNPSYVDDPNNLVGFLRADRYDAQKAAHRMLRYYSTKLELFGPSALTRNIVWEDLGPEGQAFLKRGALQILPFRDSKGRRIIWHGDVTGAEPISPEKLVGILRAFFYFLTVVAEHDNEEGRVKGCVVIIWGVHTTLMPDLDAVKATFRIRDASPTKFSAWHMCNPPFHLNFETINKYSKLLLPAMTDLGVVKLYRSHYGTELECKDCLLKEYGCPVDVFPLDQRFRGDISANNLPFTLHYVNDWIKQRIRIEYTNSKARSKKRVDSALKQIATNDKNEDVLASLTDANATTSESENFTSDGDDNDSTDDIIEKAVLTTESMEEDINERMKEDDIIPVETKSEHHDKIIAYASPRPSNGFQARLQDVLMGKSPKLRKHPGNIRLQKLVANCYDKYYAPDTLAWQKTEMAEEIVRTIFNQGGRFLRKPNKKEQIEQSWVELDFNEARAKVASMFRNITKKNVRSLDNF